MTHEDIVASEMIEENALAFIKETVKHGLPSPIDGLLTINRRALQTPKISAVEKWVKANNFVGDAMKLHNHGDTSIYQSLVNMTLPHKQHQPLMMLEGKGKSYSSPDPAASRYNALRLSDFCNDVYFKGIEVKALPSMEGDDANSIEIKYYIPKLPVVLINPMKFIGFGYGVDTAPMSVGNVCDLVIHFIKNRKENGEWDYSAVVDKFIPVFPQKGNILFSYELKEQYLKGNFNAPIKHEGEVNILSPSSFEIKTHAWGVAHSSIISRIVDEKKARRGWIDECALDDPKQLSTDSNTADCLISFKRSYGLFRALNKAKRTMCIEGNHYPQNNFQIESKLYSLSPPEVIKLWYGERRVLIMNTKRSQLQKLNQKYSEYTAILILLGDLDATVEILKSSKSKEDACARLQKKFNLTLNQALIMSKYNMFTIAGFSQDEIREKKIKAKADLKELTASFDKIDEEIIADMEYFKKQYGNVRGEYVTKVPEYIGMLDVIGEGMVCVHDLDDLRYHVDTFKYSELNFIPVRSNGTIVLRGPEFKTTTSKGGVNGLPKVNCATRFKYKSDVDEICHIAEEKIVPGYNPNYTNIRLETDHLCINRDRTVTRGNLDVLRNSRKRKHDELYRTNIKEGTKVYVIYNVKGKNELRTFKATLDVGKTLSLSAVGEWRIIDIVPVGFEEKLVWCKGTLPFSAFMLYEKFIKGDFNKISINRLPGKVNTGE